MPVVKMPAFTSFAHCCLCIMYVLSFRVLGYMLLMSIQLLQGLMLTFEIRNEQRVCIAHAAVVCGGHS